MSFFASAKMKTLISGKEWLPPLMGQGGGGGRRWVLRVVGAQAFAESEKGRKIFLARYLSKDAQAPTQAACALFEERRQKKTFPPHTK